MPAHDPGVRRASARLAATVRWHPDAGTTELTEDLERARIDERIAKIVDAAPVLTGAQRAKLAQLLRPGGGDGA